MRQLLSNADLEGLVAAFGQRVRCNGHELLGIVQNDHAESQFGNVRIAGNAPLLMLTPADVERVGLAYDTALDVELLGTWRSFVAKDQRPGTHGLTTVRLIEAT